MDVQPWPARHCFLKASITLRMLSAEQHARSGAERQFAVGLPRYFRSLS
ncbi:hypothetical protein [Mesorhizobium sp. M7A.F.Ca.CA.004.04.1.1]|nr:hypothetical protein [Mesorhizobium sp. M7A.F.Ca.CA.004.04.1.1]